MQILLPIDQNEFPDDRALAGFRLQRFEVFNWGTFDRRPWVLDLAGETALLTGANGSGKSTLVDGLLTLLVPNKKRNYNQASSTTGKRERDEKSYVQGAYDRASVEDSNASKPKLLREKGTLTVLLAYFWDAASKQKVTLAQVLWMEEGVVKKFFAIADDELTIASDFTHDTHPSNLKKRLKAMGVEVFEEFVNYSEKFRKRFGLQSEKALDLFNQTVSIKEIGGLNDFVRNHMLEKTDIQTTIQTLLKSYNDLTICHNAIGKARKQLEALTPMMEEAKKYNQLKQEIERLQHFRAVAPAYFAQQKLDLLEKELWDISQRLRKAQDELAKSARLLADLNQSKEQLIVAINQDSIGQRLQELKREIEQRQKEVDSKQDQAGKYDRLAQSLNLPHYNDSDTFYAAREQGNALKQEIDGDLQRLQAQRDEQIKQCPELQKQQTELAGELESLRQRKSQIPRENLNIRDRLARDLNLDETDLPFVGELLQVRSDAQEWEGAIERLLRSFGLCVLVPEQHYISVNTHVNKTDLRGRLVYYLITPSTPHPTQRALDPQQVPHKLEIKPGNEAFYHWLREQLVHQFSYVCCDTQEQFQHQTRAITRNGLIKHGGKRHEKDDRSRIGDRRNYILGWNNADKIKALEAELQQINQQLTRVNKQIESLESQRKQLDKQKSWLQNFMNFADFVEIDWRSIELERQNLERQRQELEASSARLKQLEQQLEAVQQEITSATQQQHNLIRETSTLENHQQTNESQKSQCESKLSQFSLQSIDKFATQFASKLKISQLTLDTIGETEDEFKTSLSEKIEGEKSKQSNSEKAIFKQMHDFKKDFIEATVDLETSLESLNEYLKLKGKIEQDDLPRHEQRFKKLMDDKILQAILSFKSSLEAQEEEIQLSIDGLNESLREIPYTDSTYIELRCDATCDREIRDFKNDLRSCLGDVARQSAEDNEKRYQNIQALLIQRFQAEERWTNKVTDVRNWLDFSVKERYCSDNTEKGHYTDSSGMSGGQKAKLAYTILASAIAYQFSLDQGNSNYKSFRFVVIDEAFSKLDDGNAQYAMELFKNLNLQLLVITPKDKINVIENYISSLHMVSITSDKKLSMIASISIEKFRQERKLALSKGHD